jgi:hypothetical protein
MFGLLTRGKRVGCQFGFLLNFGFSGRAIKVAAGQADGISPRTIEVFQVRTPFLTETQ